MYIFWIYMCVSYSISYIHVIHTKLQSVMFISMHICHTILIFSYSISDIHHVIQPSKHLAQKMPARLKLWWLAPWRIGSVPHKRGRRPSLGPCKKAAAVEPALGRRRWQLCDLRFLRLFPQQRKLLGSSAQISSGVCRCGSQEQVPEEGSGRFRRVPAYAGVGSGGRFRKVPKGGFRKVLEGSGRFRRVPVCAGVASRSRFRKVPESSAIKWCWFQRQVPDGSGRFRRVPVYAGVGSGGKLGKFRRVPVCAGVGRRVRRFPRVPVCVGVGSGGRVRKVLESSAVWFVALQPWQEQPCDCFDHGDNS